MTLEKGWLADIGKGWHTLVRPLIEQVNREPGASIFQVKEKFGGLRFYADGISSELDAAICAAEDISYTICESCGAPGKLRGNRSWIRTLCDEHAS